MSARRPAAVALLATVAALAAATGAVAAPLPVSGTLDLAADADVSILGAERATAAGWAVARLGDVDGDGLGDVALTAPTADPLGRRDAGSAWVVFGRRPLAGTPRSTVDLADTTSKDAVRIDGPAAGAELGRGVAGTGDVDGDGRPDLLLGAPGTGAVGTTAGPGAAFLVSGARVARGGRLDLADPALAVTLAGADAAGRFGDSVAGPGDVDGDGVPDLLVGQPRGAGGSLAGGAWVLLGRRGETSGVVGAPGGRAQRLSGPADGSAGLSVAGAGDVDADGRADLLVGAPLAGGRLERTGVKGEGTHPGAAYLVHGRPGTDPIDLTQLGTTGLTITGTGGELLGAAVGGLGDVTGDGVPDVGIGAPRADTRGRVDNGRLLVVPGRAAGGALTAAEPGPGAFRLDGAADGDLAGSGVDGMGDFDGDGRGDLVVAAAFAEALGRANAGSAYLVFGGADRGDADLSGLGARGVVLAGRSENDYVRVAQGAGDVTGDGVPDVVVGQLDGLDRKEPRLGGAYVVAGPTPLPPAPVLPPDPGVQEEVAMDRCRASDRVEFALDDSGSMVDSDPDRLRAQAVELLLAKPRNAGRTFGALSFGRTAQRLFPPQVLVQSGPRENREEIRRLVLDGIGADDGGTDYNAAFSALASEAPDASARILVTDGVDRGATPYADGHRGGPPTYVIGLGVGATGPEAERLRRIAKETKGAYFPGVTAATIQAVVGRIDARLNCDLAVTTASDVVDGLADVPEPNDLALPEGTNSADVTVSWPDADDEFALGELIVLGDDDEVLAKVGPKALARAVRATTARTVGRLRLTGTRGQTFVTLRVAGLRDGATLRVGVRARQLAGRRSERVRTQLSASRRRR